MKEIDDTRGLMHEEYARQDKPHHFVVPAEMAERVYKKCKGPAWIPPAIEREAMNSLKQLAREVCRAHEVKEGQETQEQFPFAWQDRYPCERNGEPVYVRIDDLEYEDYNVNISRLEAEGASKIRHALALRARRDALVAEGKLTPTGPQLDDAPTLEFNLPN